MWTFDCFKQKKLPEKRVHPRYQSWKEYFIDISPRMKGDPKQPAVELTIGSIFGGPSMLRMQDWSSHENQMIGGMVQSLFSEQISNVFYLKENAPYPSIMLTMEQVKQLIEFLKRYENKIENINNEDHIAGFNNYHRYDDGNTKSLF